MFTDDNDFTFTLALENVLFHCLLQVLQSNGLHKAKPNAVP